MNLLSSADILESFSPSSRTAAPFLSTLAQWCDSGYCESELLRKLVATYSKESRIELSIANYVHIRLAEGMLAMTDELFDSAIDHFDVVLRLAAEMNAQDVLLIANYWKARCLRKKGRHEDALTHITKVRELQVACGRVHNEAAMLTLESLIFFEKGKLNEALGNLHSAERVLGHTDDYVLLGNIQSTYGRILQQKVLYAQAIEHYMRAIELFRKRPSKYSNVARAMVDMSFTRIQVARQLRRNIDGHTAERQKHRRGPSHAMLVRELSKLYEIILGDLNEAALIYKQHPNARGVARVHLYRGYLYLDMGELDLAADEGSAVYASVESKRDVVLMASARNLQCMVENARLDEEIEGCADHSLAALDYARDAVELASNTQDRRLLGIVHTWYGLSLANPFFDAQDRARDELERAATYMEPGVRDFVWEDFQTLRARLSDSPKLDSKLREWAHGEIGNKTFRQLEEDFADLVIPKAWEQEHRKISRVAARLSISPRKVRRVLTRLGLLEPGDIHSYEEDRDLHVGSREETRPPEADIGVGVKTGPRPRVVALQAGRRLKRTK